MEILIIVRLLFAQKATPFNRLIELDPFFCYRESADNEADNAKVAGRRAELDRGRVQERPLEDGVRVQGDVRGALLREGLREPVQAEGRQFRPLQLQPDRGARLPLWMEGRLLQYP